MINKVSLGNFRIFKNITEFEILPITILTGTNNSGKSSLNKALLLMKAYFDQPIDLFTESNIIRSLDFHAGQHNLGKFQRAVNTLSRPLLFEFKFFSVLLECDLTLRYSFVNDEANANGNIESINLLKGTESLVYIINKSEYIGGVLEMLRPDIRINFSFFLQELRNISKRVNSSSDYEAGLLKKIQNNFRDEGAQVIIQLLKDFGIDNGEKLISIGTVAKIINGTNEKRLTTEELYEMFCLINQGMKNSKKEDIIDIINEYKINMLKEEFTAENDYLDELSSLTFNSYVPAFDVSYLLFDSSENLPIHLDEYVAMFKLQSYLMPNSSTGMDYLVSFIQFLFESAVFSIGNDLRDIYYIPGLRTTSFFENVIDDYRKYKGIIDEENKILSKIKGTSMRIKAYPFLKKWLNKFDIADDIDIELDKTGEKISIYIIRGKKKTLVNDMGYGISQLLPILLKFTFSFISGNDLYGRKKLIIIEEPETNLHPRLQSLLADFFIDFQKETGHRLIIETHSEYLIRKMQYLVAKNSYDRKDILLYYFRDPKNLIKGEMQVRKISIQEDGTLSKDFGPGFFDEALNWKFELMKLKNLN